METMNDSDVEPNQTLEYNGKLGEMDVTGR